MPHLNPAPWFWTLVVMWVILLTLLMPKMLLLHHIGPPALTMNNLQTHSWVWPWP